ncbi:MAG: hypothetical protein ABEI27_11485 [Halobellus sp.]|uniref:DUF7319 domain-containing protein n=1 Tax=Halobellus sp. TaxID=1979212 RepID=UPI0035D49D61
MTESSEQSSAADRHPDARSDEAPDEAAVAATDADGDTSETDDLEALRREVEETYDFENFGPAEMAEMSLEEWEAAFDPGTWVVGEELLDRVEQELNARVASREIFAVVERVTDGEDRVIAYSDEGYAVIYRDGSVEGEGTVLRDVKPTVALCSMADYDLMDAPADASLPDPEDVPEGSGEFGNLMLQIVAGVQLLVGAGLLVAWLALPSLSTIVAPIASFGFLIIGFFLFLVVANARLSDRFRVEEFRARLETLDAASEEPADVVAEQMAAAADEGRGSDGTTPGETDGPEAARTVDTADEGAGT